MRGLTLFFLIVGINTAGGVNIHESPESLAGAYMKSVTKKGDFYPRELINATCYEKFPEDQWKFFTSMPPVRIFTEEDLTYEIRKKTSGSQEGVNYCVQPELEIIIYHNRWYPDYPSGSLNIARIESAWYILVPSLDEFLFSTVKDAFQQEMEQFHEALSNLKLDSARTWRMMLDTEAKYDAIDEVSEHFGISTTASSYLLSFILENY